MRCGKGAAGASQNLAGECAGSSAEWTITRQCSGPQALLVQMQPRLPLVSAPGACVRLGTERLILGSRKSLPAVSQHHVVTAPLAAASHSFCFSREVAAYLWRMGQGLRADLLK